MAGFEPVVSAMELRTEGAVGDYGSEPLLWRLGVRIESSRDVQLLDWLVDHLGADEVRDAAYRRRHRLQPPPSKVAEELGIKLPDELRSNPDQVWQAGSAHAHRAN